MKKTFDTIVIENTTFWFLAQTSPGTKRVCILALHFSDEDNFGHNQEKTTPFTSMFANVLDLGATISGFTLDWSRACFLGAENCLHNLNLPPIVAFCQTTGQMVWRGLGLCHHRKASRNWILQTNRTTESQRWSCHVYICQFISGKLTSTLRLFCFPESLCKQSQPHTQKTSSRLQWDKIPCCSLPECGSNVYWRMPPAHSSYPNLGDGPGSTPSYRCNWRRSDASRSDQTDPHPGCTHHNSPLDQSDSDAAAGAASGRNYWSWWPQYDRVNVHFRVKVYLHSCAIVPFPVHGNTCCIHCTTWLWMWTNSVCASARMRQRWTRSRNASCILDLDLLCVRNTPDHSLDRWFQVHFLQHGAPFCTLFSELFYFEGNSPKTISNSAGSTVILELNSHSWITVLFWWNLMTHAISILIEEMPTTFWFWASATPKEQASNSLNFLQTTTRYRFLN